MDGVGGTVKNMIFKKVKSGHVLINTPKDFAEVAMRFVPNISTVYLPRKNIMEEPTDTADAPAIKGTLKMHMLKRKIVNGVPVIDFFELASDTQWYKSESGGVQCGHDFDYVDDNHCGRCRRPYTPADNDWLKCPICAAWWCEECFYLE